MKKQILIAILSIVMLVGLMPITAFAATDPSVLVGGVEMYSASGATYYVNGATTAVTTEPNNWNAKYENGILTIKNLSVVGAAADHKYAGIYATTALTIDVQGANSVTGADCSGAVTYGVYIDGALTIQGDGALSVTGGTATSGGSFGISTTNGNDISITENVVVNATGGTAGTTNGSKGIDCGGTLLIEGNATINATGGSAGVTYGIYSKSVTVTGGVTVATGGTASGTALTSYGISISSFGDATVTTTGGVLVARAGSGTTAKAINGTLTTNGTQIAGQVVGGTFAGSPASYDTNATAVAIVPNSYTVKNTKLTEDGVTEYTINTDTAVVVSGAGSDIPLTISGDSTVTLTEDLVLINLQGVFTVPALQLSGSTTKSVIGPGTLTAIGAAKSDGNSYGITSVNSTDLSVDGAKVIAIGGTASEKSNGIKNVNVTVGSSGSITAIGGAAATSYGIESKTTVNSGTLNAIGGAASVGSYGISGTTTVNGGTLNAIGGTASTNSYGINGQTTANGGTLNAIGGAASGMSCGIYYEGGIGLSVANGAAVTAIGGTYGLAAKYAFLSGGSFTGGTGAVHNLQDGGTVAALLDSGYGYFAGETQLIPADSDATVGDPNQVVTVKEIPIPHEHPVCGDAECASHGDDVTFEPWTATDSLPTTADNYYLTADVEIASTWEPANGTVLCLNGHKITMTGSGDVIVAKNFTLTDCRTTQGEITHSSGATGDGVKVSSNGTFDMYGGSITGNNNSANAGGVKVAYGTFNMYGGSITNNKASSGLNGGGVYIDSPNRFNMYGGTISGNTASSGGGVYVRNNATFNMYGGTISGNTATLDGGGVYVLNTTSVFNISGGPVITGNTVGSRADNVYLPSGITITVNGALTGGNNSIGVRMAAPGVFAKPDGANVTELTAADAAKFTSDDDGYVPAAEGGELKLAAPITYTVTYNGNGATSGTVPTDGTSYASGSTVTVLGNTGNLAKTGYAFVGWNTWSSGYGTDYVPGATFNINSNTTLYAQWEEYEITSQPTESTPAVGTNADGDIASYQWYKGTMSDVTDTAAGVSAYTEDELTSTYSDGWWTCHGTGETTPGYFTIALNAGDSILAQTSAKISEGQLGIWAAYENQDWDWTTPDDHFLVTAPADGNYDLHVSDVTYGGGTQPTVKAQVFHIGSTPADGATSKSLVANEDGWYACKITYKDGTVLYSGPVEYDAPSISVTDVTLDKESVTLGVGGTATLTATVAPDDATNKAVSWSSDAESVATVENGVVTAVGEGTATITVTTTDGDYTDTCTVTVLAAHAHPICGAAHTDIEDHTGSCEDITWTAWDGTDKDGETNGIQLTEGNWYLTDDVTLTETLIISSGEVNLCLNGCSITRSDWYPTIRIKDGATLNLCDCNGSGKNNGSVTNNFGVCVVNEGALTVYGGTVEGPTWGITNSGTLTVYGGRVASTGERGIYNAEGTVYVYGGTVSGNSYGIYNEGGTANVTGGTVTATGSNGYGIYNRSNGTVTVSGGTVTATGDNSWGIYNHSDGASDVGTTTNVSGTANVSGRILGIYNSGTLTVSGGTIKSTGTDGNNYGIYNFYHGAGSLELSGAPTITGATAGVYLDGGSITLGGELTYVEENAISVGMETPGTFTSGWNSNMSGKTPGNYFTSAMDGYKVVANGQELDLVTEPVGKLIISIEKISTEGLVDTYRITYDDGTTYDFTVTNGADGSNGSNGSNGQNGTNGITPTFKIENGELKVSYDNGTNWTSLGNIQGADGTDGSDGQDGSNGVDGKTPSFKVENGNLYVRYSDTEEWTLLGNIQGADGTDGADGSDGQDGKTPTFKVENDVLYVSYDNGTSWTALGNIGGSDGTDGSDGQDGSNGVDGKTPSFKVENGNLYVRYSDTEEWTLLGNIQGANGSDGADGSDGQDGVDGADGITPTFKIENGELKVSYDNGTTWASLGNIQGTNGADGTNGNDGQDGADGVDGKTPTFKIENGELKVSYDNGATWTSLGNVQGADGVNGTDGTNGTNGTNGVDGKTPTFKIENGELKVSYDNGTSWTSLGTVKGADGADGTDGRNGSSGSNGKDGKDGKDGITPQLRINTETNEWEVSYDNGTTWISLGVKATGEKGDKGDKGDTGAAGADGKDGIDGKDGVDGKDGAVIDKGADGLVIVAIIIGCIAIAGEIAFGIAPVLPCA